MYVLVYSRTWNATNSYLWLKMLVRMRMSVVLRWRHSDRSWGCGRESSIGRRLVMAQASAELRSSHELTSLCELRLIQIVHMASVQMRWWSCCSRTQRDVWSGIGPDWFVAHGKRHWHLNNIKRN